MGEPDKFERPPRPGSKGQRAAEKHRRPRITIEEQSALADRFDRLANRPRLSDEQRAEARRRADQLRAINRWQIEQEAKEAEAARAHFREQLSYVHMILLAETLVGWAQDARTTKEWAARLLQISDQLRDLAEEVGPDWNPPEPERISLMGFIGRLLAEPD